MTDILVLPNRYGSFIKRAIAALIDGFIIGAISLLNVTLTGGDQGLQEMIGVLISIAAFLYYILLHLKTGQTLGKKALGLTVVDEKDESRLLRPRQAIAREIPTFIITVISYLLSYVAPRTVSLSASTNYMFLALALTFGIIAVEIICFWASPRNRALRDICGGSVVIEVD